jgi:titin
LAFDEDENMLYVADTENNRIQVFEIIAGNTCPSGTDEIIDGVCFVEEFGSSGSTDGKFNAPSGLALDEDNGLLYVADTDNNRIQMLTIPTGDSSSSSSSSSKDVPDSPKGLSASAASPSSIVITWDTPDPEDNDPKITGYKIEVKEGSGSYETIVTDTKSTATSFLHTGLDDGETYRYRAYAINSEGTSSVSSTASAKPGPTKTPAGLTAVPISKNQILLSWLPPSETFNQSVTGYIIEREIISDILYEDVNRVSGSTTTYTVTGLETGKTYSYVVSAEFSVGNTPRSDAATATPELDSTRPPASSTSTSSSSSVTAPTTPRNLKADESPSQIQLSWTEPSSDGNSKITGYKIEVKKDSGSYSVLKSNTNTSATSYVDSNVQMGSTYTYRVYAINSVGFQLSPLGKFTIDEKKTLSFTVKITDSSLNNVAFSLEKSPPAGAKINSNTGLFTWTPTDSQGAKSYVFDIVAKKDSMVDRQSVTITVNDIKISEPVKEPEPTTKPTEPKELGIASFVDKTKDPQSYVDRYNNEATYKEWFDDNFAEYDSIYQAVGLEEPKVEEKKFGICGPGTKLIDGVCTIVVVPDVKPWWHFW